VQPEHTLSINEILQEHNLKITEEDSKVFCILDFVKSPNIHCKSFPIYAIILQLYHVYPVSKAPKLPESNHVFLSIQIVPSKYFLILWLK